MDPVLDALRQQLSTALGLPVAVGSPAAPGTGLLLWPWRIAEIEGTRMRPPSRGGVEVAPARPRVCLSVLVLSADGTASLCKALAWASANPLLPVGERSASLRRQQLSAEELAAIFATAGIALAPALCWDIED